MAAVANTCAADGTAGADSQALTWDDEGRLAKIQRRALNDSGLPGLKVHARNVSLSMRHTPAHPGPKVRQRSGDVVVTADGERIAADAYPDRVVDLELVHHG